MRRAAFGLAVLLAAVPVAAAPPTPPKPPADFTLPKADGSPGTVTFSHRAHLVTATKCSTCHMRDLKMKRGASGPITLEAKQQGKYCGVCHDGKHATPRGTVFSIDECDRCHKD